MTEFKIGERVRLLRKSDGQHGQTGIVSGVQSTEQMRSRDGEMAVSESHRGYIVTMDVGNTRFVSTLDLEAE